MRFEGKSEIRELQVLGDWAYIRSYLEVSMAVPRAEAVRRKGYVLSILRKGEDGRWRIVREANLLTKV